MQIQLIWIFWIISIQFKININQYINGNFFLVNSNLSTIESKNFGLGSGFVSKFECRFEVFKTQYFSNLVAYKWVALLHEMDFIVPKHESIKNKLTINIAFLDLIMTYRGWRHFYGLPVRGQRTWTNSRTVYRSNLVLRDYKVMVAKRLYGTIPLSELNTLQLAERVNMLWKLQWENEWRAAKKKRLHSVKSNSKVTSVDLYSMSRGFVNIESKKKKDKKKAKANYSKNVLSLGFDPGFAKALMQSNITLSSKKKKMKSQSKVNLILDKPVISKIKKIKKKVK